MIRLFLVPALAFSSVFASASRRPDIYSDLTGTRGTILCFHGGGGSSQGWKKKDGKKEFLVAMRAKGLSFLCPSASSRDGKWVDADVARVDELIASMNPPRPLYLVGHSNGGGFVTRFGGFSRFKPAIAGAQISNASGLVKLIGKEYRVPTLFNYSKCDPTIDPKDVLRSVEAARAAGIRVQANVLPQCAHEFMSTPDVTAAFWGVR